ncbi:LuxR C-terminal-related transcriptional regulator [Empedobacter tilapiae]|nr:LuxR C-terminal-related transcriptional regulator [Empedobacter tilapiae]
MYFLYLYIMHLNILLKKYLAIIICVLFAHIGFSAFRNSEILKEEIAKYNSQGQYNESIIRLDQIIHDKKSTNYALYNAYLQKYLTYKSLLNYPQAEENLNIAEKYGLKNKQHIKEIKTRILVERIFIEFDHLRFIEVDQLLKKIVREDLSTLDPETHAFFISVLGTDQARKKNFEKAIEEYQLAIDILEKNNPKHLPNIYRKLINIYSDIGDEEKSMQAFEKGIYYAKKYNMDLYIYNMYDSLSYHYAKFKKWEKAYETRVILAELSTKLDAINQSGKLQILEQEIQNNRSNLEIRNQKNIKIFLFIISFFLIVLIIVIYKLYQTNKEKRILVENENQRMRDKLTELSNQISNKNNISKHNADRLSERQTEIVNLVKKGLTNKEIAEQLFISENTVKYHLKSIYTLLGIDSRNSL